MADYIISTDTNSDLPFDYAKKNGLLLIPLGFTIDGVTYSGFDDKMVGAEFYNKMRNGSTPTTAQVNMDDAKNGFEPVLKEGKDIIHISFSSGLSGSFNSVRLAAEELLSEYPERKIIVIDSLCASLGEGLLVHKAIAKKNEGATIEELSEYVENIKLKICHNFTVEDLKYLYRGGRVSKTTVVVGTALGIKPIMRVDNEGKLVPCGKVRGRKASLNAIVENMEKQCQGIENDIIFISHGDCPDDANYVAELVKKKFGIKEFLINNVGPSIGAHSGPGTMALFFVGNER